MSQDTHERNLIFDYGISVDKIVTSIIKPSIRPASGIPAGIDEARFRAGRIHMLYDAAVRKQGGSLCMQAAERLAESPKGSNVLLLTGFVHPVYYPKGETDGPPGAAGLAGVLSFGLGLKPVLIAEAALSDVLSAVCLAAGLVTDWDRSRGYRIGSASVMSFPVVDVKASEEEAKRLLDDLKPSAVVAVERPGRNSKGEYHSVLGSSTTGFCARLDCVMEEAKKRGILTVGIGDNGNEAGYGNIVEDVKKIQMFGEKCQCPCGSGIATVVESDVLVPASTSNWGAYGVEACLALLLKKPHLMHDSDVENRMLTACANLGCADGSTTYSTPTCDGTGKASLYIADTLRTLVELSTISVVRAV